MPRRSSFRPKVAVVDSPWFRDQPPMEINLEIFKKNYLVVGLSDEDIRRVAELSEFRVVAGGTEIVKLGDKNPDLFVIIDGSAIVYAKGGVVLGERGPGSVVGEITLVDNQPRSA